VDTIEFNLPGVFQNTKIRRGRILECENIGINELEPKSQQRWGFE